MARMHRNDNKGKNKEETSRGSPVAPFAPFWEGDVTRRHKPDEEILNYRLMTTDLILIFLIMYMSSCLDFYQ